MIWIYAAIAAALWWGILLGLTVYVDHMKHIGLYAVKD